MNNDDDHIEVKTPFATFSGWGRDVILIFFIAGIGLLTASEHFRREMEHEQILCVLGLDIWLHTEGQNKSFRDIPREYLKCLPVSMFEMEKKHG